MNRHSSCRPVFVAALLFAMAAVPARAADQKVEVGASLASVMVIFDDNTSTLIGIPSTGIGNFLPGVYVSLFLVPHVSVEPQIGFTWLQSGGSSGHFLNFSGQVNYFVNGTGASSPYVFGGAGVIDISGSNTSPKTLSAGAGYRIPVGDRLTFRIDGRYMHITDGGGNAVVFTASIGGMLGR